MSSLGQHCGTSSRNLFLLGLFFFLAAASLYIPHAGFPSYYHADEPSKVDQLVHEYRNFKHPPLMLNATETVATVLHTDRENEALVRVGRCLSALYAAGTIALLAVLAASLRNLITGFVMGLLGLCLCPLYEAAHYFKEDTLFLFLGVLTVVLIAFYQRVRQSALGKSAKPDLWPLVLGVSAGLLVCSRYFTLLLIPIIFLGLGFYREKKTALAFAAGLIGIICVVHLPSLHWLPYYVEELPLETHYMLTGHYGVGLAVPHAEYFRYWTGETTPLIWFFLASFFLFQLWQRQPGLGLAVAVLMAYWLSLSCLPKYSERYFLPVLLGNLFFVALGADNLVQTFGNLFKRWKGPLVCLGWILVLTLLLPPAVTKLVQMERGFEEDSRAELVSWIRINLPPGSLIAQDDLVRLEALPGEKYTCFSAEFVPDLGTVQDLQKRGIHYVAICRRSHFPYTEPGLQASNNTTEEFLRRREFYLALLQHGKILWNSPDYDPKMLHPGITLVDIQKIKATP